MASTTYSMYHTDESREKGGVTLDLGDGGKFKLARAGGGNDRFDRRLAVITKPHRRAIQSGAIDKKTSERLLAQVYAETVLIGWEGVTGPDGKPLEFSQDNALKLLTDLPDLFRDIREVAEDASLFRQETLEEDAKN